MHRLGVEHSYTLEASFGGSTLGDRAGTHLGVSDLEMMGKHICDTLLDYFDPDPTKVTLIDATLDHINTRTSVYTVTMKY